MSEASTRNRAPISLDNKLEQKIFSYAAAAGAAGVTVMALAQPGQAEVVFTPTHQVIAANQTYALDLNHDGITDFIFRNNYFGGANRANRQGGVFPTGGSYTYGGIKASPVTPNRVLVNERQVAPDLKVGHRVGPLADWDPKEGLMWGCDASEGSPFATFGSWKDVTSRYLGLEFVIDGQIHFGWARLSVTATNCTVTATLTGYAYETIPNKPIATGETSGAVEGEVAERPHAMLGALAIGSPALAVWRRDQGSN
ncbi:MAG TPA: hypothetical protein VGG14_07745 [Candidatus Sulfotelmatobacter sp.]|jgi:hypothetical protein